MLRKQLVIYTLGLVVAVGLMSAGPAFGIWPFSSEEESARININTADQATLAAIPGVGAAKAGAIVEYRNKNGPFETLEELKNVPGVDEQALADLKAKITVGEEEQSSPRESPTQDQTKMTRGQDEG